MHLFAFSNFFLLSLSVSLSGVTVNTMEGHVNNGCTKCSLSPVNNARSIVKALAMVIISILIENSP